MTTDNDDVYLGYSVDNGGSDKACHIPVDKSATAVILKIETGKPKENEDDQDTFTMTLAQAPSISFELEGKLSVWPKLTRAFPRSFAFFFFLN